MTRLHKKTLTTGGESHLRVAPEASTALDFAEDTPATAGEAVNAVMRPSPPTGART